MALLGASCGFGGVFNKRGNTSSPFSWSLSLGDLSSVMPQPIGKKVGPRAYVIFGSGGEDAITNVPDLAALANQKSRDKLAHHLWGWDNRLPNALLLGDPRDLVTGEGLRDCIFVYEKPDLERIIAANKRLFHFLSSFHMFLDKHPAYEDRSKFDQLCDEPEIRERLDRQA